MLLNEAKLLQNSASVIQRNQDMWGSRLDNSAAIVPSFIEPEVVDEVLAAARASQRQEHAHLKGSRDKDDNATLR